MRLIHLADLHLDSKLNSNFNREQSRERRSELLNNFSRLIDFAVERDVDAILIAGDLFDTGFVSAIARNYVENQIRNNIAIDFYYLKGNHDGAELFKDSGVPVNYHDFSNEWRSYELTDGRKVSKRIVLSGVEIPRVNGSKIYSALRLDESCINIVMLHGQLNYGKGSDNANVIPMNELENRGIDYLALGHIHKYKKERLDVRGVYCYPGCLEGRGFDECGEKGFVLINIDEYSGCVESEFVPFAKRTLYEPVIDVSKANNSAEIIDIIEAYLKNEYIKENSLVKIRIVGELDINCELDIHFVKKHFENRFYYVKLSNETEYKIDIEKYMMDDSLKGEFVRLVMAATDIDKEDKTRIIRYGLRAIDGEEIFGCF